MSTTPVNAEPDPVGQATPSESAGSDVSVTPRLKAAGRSKAKARATANKDVRKKPKPSSPSKQPTKAERILALLRRPHAASIPEIVKATGWQAHSVRGFLSTIKRTAKIALASERTEGKDRRYRVK